MIVPAPIGIATVLIALSLTEVTGYTAQDDSIEMRTVVGCLARAGESWTLEQVTAGEPTERAFTSREELDTSKLQKLGVLIYRLLGIAEFGVAELEGHKVQVEGLRISNDNDLRLNVTSFQHLDPLCQ
ncbi:MAG: hypothetical protein VX453_15935 [Acidobacteriota bacterium]|nr:hypothetical protein [Acidobacteriota bacterium]